MCPSRLETSSPMTTLRSAPMRSACSLASSAPRMVSWSVTADDADPVVSQSPLDDFGGAVPAVAPGGVHVEVGDSGQLALQN